MQISSPRSWLLEGVLPCASLCASPSLATVAALPPGKLQHSHKGRGKRTLSVIERPPNQVDVRAMAADARMLWPPRLFQGGAGRAVRWWPPVSKTWCCGTHGVATVRTWPRVVQAGLSAASQKAALCVVMALPMICCAPQTENGSWCPCRLNRSISVVSSVACGRATTILRRGPRRPLRLRRGGRGPGRGRRPRLLGPVPGGPGQKPLGHLRLRPLGHRGRRRRRHPRLQRQLPGSAGQLLRRGGVPFHLGLGLRRRWRPRLPGLALGSDGALSQCVIVNRPNSRVGVGWETSRKVRFVVLRLGESAIGPFLGKAPRRSLRFADMFVRPSKVRIVTCQTSSWNVG